MPHSTTMEEEGAPLLNGGTSVRAQYGRKRFYAAAAVSAFLLLLVAPSISPDKVAALFTPRSKNTVNGGSMSMVNSIECPPAAFLVYHP